MDKTTGGVCWSLRWRDNRLGGFRGRLVLIAVYAGGVVDEHFPDLRLYEEAPEAFLGGELNRDWVLEAYPKGFFPWPDGDGQLMWCNPLERMLFEIGEWQAPKRLVRELRRGDWEVRLDGDFESVIRACQTVGREDGTWITKGIKRVYGSLFDEGLAHSVGVYQEGQLVGGLYGLSLGDAFFGESMFSSVSNGSKVALAVLLAYLEDQGFALFDAQLENPHLVNLGGRLQDRDEYLDRLDKSLKGPTRRGPWALREGFVTQWFNGAGATGDRG